MSDLSFAADAVVEAIRQEWPQASIRIDGLPLRYDTSVYFDVDSNNQRFILRIDDGILAETSNRFSLEGPDPSRGAAVSYLRGRMKAEGTLDVLKTSQQREQVLWASSGVKIEPATDRRTLNA
ncbi:MAG: hypothetical protein ACRD3S_02575 [Terracidiphilus sp.]